MATERVSMREFRKILGLRNEAKLSYEKIAVRRYLHPSRILQSVRPVGHRKTRRDMQRCIGRAISDML